MPPSEQVQERKIAVRWISTTPYPITLTRVALDNVTSRLMTPRIGDGLHLRPELAGENLDPEPTSLKGLLIALPKVAEVAQEEVVEPRSQNPQPEGKPLGETLKNLFSRRYCRK